MFSRIGRDEIQKNYFSDLDSESYINIKNNEKSIFGISLKNGEIDIQFENRNVELIEILDRGGFFDLDLECIPPTSHVDPSFSMKKTGVYDSGNWLKRAISITGIGGYIVPDTNIMYRCYYSNFLKLILSEITGPYAVTRILIPRLLVLEIENKFNRSPERSKEKRIAYNSMGELHKIISDGGLFSSKIDYSLLREFSNVAGKKFADSFIRMEISKYHIDDYSSPSKYSFQHPITFFTCDEMNAMAGSAEGLNCVYFYRSNRLRKKNLDIASIVYHTAIQFADCNFSIKTAKSEKYFEVKGIWEGKSPSDWKMDSIMINEL